MRGGGVLHMTSPTRKPPRFYDGTPGRTLVPCPDCGRSADESLGGDHGGQCIDTTRVGTPRSALGILHKAAREMRRLSMNELRPLFDAAEVKQSSRGPAFTSAQRRGWIERDGSVASISGKTKGHEIHTYRSKIHPSVVAAARVEGTA